MNLKKLRLQNQLTQREVAEAVNLTQFTYSNYEIEKTEPNIDTLIKLADFYHTTIDNLVDHEVPYLINKSQFTQTQLNIIDEIKMLSEDTCKRIEAYILGLSAGEEQRREIIQKFKY